jgi:DNA-binding PadR family transcriptional regulator
MIFHETGGESCAGPAKKSSRLVTADVLAPLHGYGIARRIEQISGDLLAVNQGTLYHVLLELEQEGAIASEWGTSENNRRARFYRLTREGQAVAARNVGLGTNGGDYSPVLRTKAEDFVSMYRP